MSRNTLLYLAARTHIGRVRELNEDSFFAVHLPEGALLAVADGMGGTNAGEVASAILIGRANDAGGDDNITVILAKVIQVA